MTDLDQKVAAAQALIRRVLETYKRPAVMSSFGKDSMVMLDILKRMGVKLPVIFHREPYCPSKDLFANEAIEREQYAVFDYQPSETAVVKNNGHMEIVNFYQVGPRLWNWMPTGIRKPEEGKPWLCGYVDLYRKPFGTFEFPWDVAFLGHKSSDVDPVLGPIPLAVDIKVNDGGCHYAYPVRHFTDADVWSYTEQFGVPFNEKRYDKANGYREFSDITWNNDYYHACTRCLDRDEPPVVFCPRLGYEIPNISKEIRSVEPTRPAYITAFEALAMSVEKRRKLRDGEGQEEASRDAESVLALGQ